MAESHQFPGESEVPEGPDERQRFPRQQVILAARLRDSQGTVDCDVLDFSAGGARVQAAVPFPVNAEVQLELGDSHSLSASVVWCNETVLGLEFHESPERVAAAMPGILAAAKDERERRRHVRSSVIWTAEIYGGLRHAKCEILNISSAGAKLRTPGNFAAGSQVTVRSIHFGEFQAQVIWQDREHNTIGIAFPQSDRILQILHKSGHTGRR